MTFSLRSIAPRHAARRNATNLAVAGIAASDGATSPQVVFTHNTSVDAFQIALTDGQIDPHFVLADTSTSPT